VINTDEVINIDIYLPKKFPDDMNYFLLYTFKFFLYLVFYLELIDIPNSNENVTFIKCSDICLQSKWNLQDIKAAGFISPDLHVNDVVKLNCFSGRWMWLCKYRSNT